MNFFNKLIYSRDKGFILLRHSLFWLADMFNWLMVIATSRPMAWRDVYFFLVLVPIPMMATYIILYYLVPRFSSKEKGRTLISIVAVLFIMGLAIRVYKFYVVIPLVNWDPIPANELYSLGGIIGEVFKWLAVVCMAVTIKLLKNSNELQRKNEQLLHEKKSAELNFLKLQMNPHFLFNTLNTLYSETIQQSDKAEQVVMHLSNLMRFILEECNKQTIPLEHEIKVIQDYIALEKLRHGSRLNINLSLPPSTPNMQVSPLLFLPFVENSFKHSLNHVRGSISIDIKIVLESNQLKLIVENDHDKENGKNGFSRGTGITNIKRQLELLYDQQHTLSIHDAGKKYRVELTLPTDLS